MCDEVQRRACYAVSPGSATAAAVRLHIMLPAEAEAVPFSITTAASAAHLPSGSEVFIDWRTWSWKAAGRLQGCSCVLETSYMWTRAIVSVSLAEALRTADIVGLVARVAHGFCRNQGFLQGIAIFPARGWDTADLENWVRASVFPSGITAPVGWRLVVQGTQGDIRRTGALLGDAYGIETLGQFRGSSTRYSVRHPDSDPVSMRSSADTWREAVLELDTDRTRETHLRRDGLLSERSRKIYQRDSVQVFTYWEDYPLTGKSVHLLGDTHRTLPDLSME